MKANLGGTGIIMHLLMYIILLPVYRVTESFMSFLWLAYSHMQCMNVWLAVKVKVNDQLDIFFVVNSQVTVSLIFSVKVNAKF